MDVLCLKAGGIHGIAATPISASSGNGGELRSQPPRNLPWGFTFKHPLRSLWPVGKNRYEPAMAVDDTVLVDEKEKEKDIIINEVVDEEEGRNGNWVFKILHVKSLWKKGQGKDEGDDDLVEEDGDSNEECDVCVVSDDYDGDNIVFDKESFSKLLRKVSLGEARFFAKMSHLGSLAYSIPQIKPENLLRHHGLRFITSSIEKKEESMKLEKEKLLALGINNVTEQAKEARVETNGNRISSFVAYEMAASAASYLHSHTKSILRFKSSKSNPNENLIEDINGGRGRECVDMSNQDMASLMATTDSVTSVVAAKEEVKQAVADDLNSIKSSPCEWFVCDDDQSFTRVFVVQGSESLASWKANLLFEPVQFEGLDVLVHRGIYEAAKGIYEQMLPEIRAHLESQKDRAKFRFTGHSLGGSLSLLVNLMLLIRGEAPQTSLLPVITFGSPSIMCGGDGLLYSLGLPRNHVRSITMHRDIVPRAFSCNYPTHVAEFLKAVNRNFRSHPCLNKQKLLYAPMGEFLILQPDEKFSPSHDLLPPGTGLYILTCPISDISEADKQIRAAQAVFMNSPHPLEILSDRSAYGSEGTIRRDHDMDSYLKCVRNVIRQELSRIRKSRRDHRRKVWWPLLTPNGVNAGLIVSKHHIISSDSIGQGQVKLSGIFRRGKESLKRFSTLVASQHMHLFVVLLFPARLLILGMYSLINIH